METVKEGAMQGRNNQLTYPVPFYKQNPTHLRTIAGIAVKSLRIMDNIHTLFHLFQNEHYSTVNIIQQWTVCTDFFPPQVKWLRKKCHNAILNFED